MMRGGFGGASGGAGGWGTFLRQDESIAPPKITRSILVRVFSYGRPYWFYIFIVLVTIAVVSLIELIPPLLYRALIDTVLPNHDLAKLNLLAIGMIGIPLLS